MPWYRLNTKGKFLYVACLLNIYSAGVTAWNGSWFCVFSVIMAAFCGMMTFQERYRHLTAQEINERATTNKQSKKGVDE